MRATTTTRTTPPSCTRACRSSPLRSPRPSGGPARAAATSSPRVAAGLETICRLGVATRIGIIESGWMYTPLFGHFAATVAAGRVLGLDVTQMVNALGIVYSQVAGNHQVTRDGALTKRMQPGFAAQAALVSVQLAQRGVRGAQATFEGVDGFLRVYLRDRCDRDVLRKGLGEHYEFTELSYKPYPCCRFNHTAIDAALALRASAGVSAERVRRIRVGVNRQAYEAVATPVDVRKAPRTIVHAQFSLPFTVAAALVDGRVELGSLHRSVDPPRRHPRARAAGGRVRGRRHRARMGTQHLAGRLARRDGRRDDARPARRLAARSSAPADVGLRTSTPRPSIAFAHRRSRLREDAPRAAARASSTLSSRATTFARSCTFCHVHRDARLLLRLAKETK